MGPNLTPVSAEDNCSLERAPRTPNTRDRLVRSVGGRPWLLAGAFLVLCVTVVQWPFIWPGHVPITQDVIHLFYPLNHLTGQLLREGRLPVWNIHQMAGMPLIGDPEAGWGSITAMVAYATLSLPKAGGAMMLAHMVLAALGMLLFMRSTGVGVPGATLAAVAYWLSTQIFAPRLDLAYGNLSYIGVVSWLPWLLIGIDVAVRHGGRRRLAGWTLTAFAASQELSIWFGQGAYYALGAAAAYLLFLTVIGPSSVPLSAVARLRQLALHSVALSLLTSLLSAWTLFPRLELLAVSNLSGGYSEGEQQFAGGSPWWVGRLLLEFSSDYSKPYIGAATVLLMLGTLFLRARRTQAFYAAMVVLTYLVSLRWLVAATSDSETVRTLVGLVPGALELHLHYPERVAFVYVFFASALAGTAMDAMLQARGRLRMALPAALALSFFAVLVSRGGTSWWTYRWFAMGTGVFTAVVLLTWYGKLHSRWAAVILVGFTAAELMLNVATAHDQAIKIEDPTPYYATPNNQAVADRLGSAVGSERFFGYDPRTLRSSAVGYRKAFAEPVAVELMLLAQATVLGLEDLQGYNPIHLRSYDRLLAVANGKRQNYRSAYIMPSALDSQLIDMLNARYVVTKPHTKLKGKFELVGSDDGVSLYRNRAALPRAWVVHEAVVGDDEEALYAIHNHTIDPRRAAVTPTRLDGLRKPSGAEQVGIRRYEPDHIDVDAALTAPGLLVLSELDYPAWKVKIDGKPQPVIRANGALRAVQVPAGRHTVTWYYSSAWTWAGIYLSLAGAIGLTLTFVFWQRLPSTFAG